jgi:hypothetical protein
MLVDSSGSRKPLASPIATQLRTQLRSRRPALKRRKRGWAIASPSTAPTSAAAA